MNEFEYIDKYLNIDLKGKNVFVTGGNSGVGYEICNIMSYKGANIYMLSRNESKATDAIDSLKKMYPNINYIFIKLDLSSFESIKNAVEEIKKYDVDIFINNAGVFRLPKGVTKDNIEITCGTNFIGTMYLNELLEDYFKSLNHDVKVMLTTSVTSRMFKIDYNDFLSLKKYRPLVMYGKTKVMINDLFFYYLDKYKDSNIKYSLIHPGATYTPLITKGYRNKGFEKVASIFMKSVFHTPLKASLTALKALEKDYSMVGPKGFLEISGWPKFTSFKRNKTYLKTIETAKGIIGNIDNEIYSC